MKKGRKGKGKILKPTLPGGGDSDTTTGNKFHHRVDTSLRRKEYRFPHICGRETFSITRLSHTNLLLVKVRRGKGGGSRKQITFKDERVKLTRDEMTKATAWFLPVKRKNVKSGRRFSRQH